MKTKKVKANVASKTDGIGIKQHNAYKYLGKKLRLLSSGNLMEVVKVVLRKDGLIIFKLIPDGTNWDDTMVQYKSVASTRLFKEFEDPNITAAAKMEE